MGEWEHMGWRRQGCGSLAGSEAEDQAVVGLSGGF